MNIFKDYYRSKEETIKKLNLFFELEDLSEELDLFFYEKNGESIASKYVKNLLKSDNLSKHKFLCPAFEKEVEIILKDVIEFYFNDYINGDDLKLLREKIINSDYPDNIKRSLYSFFIEPTDLVLILKKDIENVSKQVSVLYKLKKDKEKVYLSIIQEKISNLNLECKKNIYYGFSLVFKDRIYTFQMETKLVMIIGTNSDEFETKSKDIELHPFGSVISDKSRIEILNFLYKNPLSDIKKINEKIEIKQNTLFYHINFMLQYHVIKKHTKGKKVFYEINNTYLNNVVRILNKYVPSAEV